MMPLAGKVAIIAGGTTGLGLACARRFVRDGAAVVVAGTNDAAGLAAEKELTVKGGRARFVYCDVGDRLDVHNLIAAALEAFDRIDILVNDSGHLEASSLMVLKEDAFERAMRINVKGALFLAQAAARQFIAQIEREDGGRLDRRPYVIVNMGAMEQASSEDCVAAAVSRGALHEMTRALAASLSPQGIRVNALEPGAHLTGTGPGGARPEEVAALCAFLAGDDAASITGHCIAVEGVKGARF
jgi:NAD(P)-dependent dehydrogenase (short-subunit alcohol dehydrogenase family)